LFYFHVAIFLVIFLLFVYFHTHTDEFLAIFCTRMTFEVSGQHAYRYRFLFSHRILSFTILAHIIFFSCNWTFWRSSSFTFKQFGLCPIYGWKWL